MNNKAAMFGLDARIALAIFGALSVISGAALYRAIQEAKVTAIITEISEASKAIDSYYLDTGTDIPKDSAFFIQMSQLVSSGVKGWSGPYLPYTSPAAHTLDHPVYGSVFAATVKDTA